MVTASLCEISSKNESFIYFISGRKSNRVYLFSAIGISIVLWLIFKFCYPNPNMVLDSYHYVQAAANNADVNTWPIGYSKFIRLTGFISHSATFLVTLQYLFMQVALLFFFFSIRFFFRMTKWSTVLLFLFLFLNPIILYTCNLILADALFIALSICWFTHLCWIICYPRSYMILTHALLLIVTFTVRYNALYYPIIASLAFILSQRTVWFKAGGIFLQCILFAGFILFTSNKMYSVAGEKQFAPFGGWKLANDALYVYGHVYKQAHTPVPEKFSLLDNMVRYYYDTSTVTLDILSPEATSGSYYMFMRRSPLKQYMFSKYGADPSLVNFKKFADMGPLYGEYGFYLIKRYPIEFMKYFVFPNMQRYLLPPSEIYGTPSAFLIRRDELEPIPKNWFGVNTLLAPIRYIQIREAILSVYPIFMTISHIVFVFSCLAFFILKKYRRIGKQYLYIILTAIGFWLCDLSFNLLAAAVVLRYLLFVMIIEITFSLIFIERILDDKA